MARLQDGDFDAIREPPKGHPQRYDPEAAGIEQFAAGFYDCRVEFRDSSGVQAGFIREVSRDAARRGRKPQIPVKIQLNRFRSRHSGIRGHRQWARLSARATSQASRQSGQ